jgi:energy-coupling factor transporter ATP-binding protein EcfA2
MPLGHLIRPCSRSVRSCTEPWHVGRDVALLCDAPRNAISLGRARHLHEFNHIGVTLERDEGSPAWQGRGRTRKGGIESMRLTDLEARELLSFDSLRLSDLPQTLVVVGPNGAGKTNLLRLLQIVLVAIDRAATFSQDAYWALVRFATTRRIGAAPADMSSVRLGITLTEPWERELLLSFVRAAIASAILRDTPTNGDASASIAWVREHVSEAMLAPLASGAIVIDFVDAATGPWIVGYEFGVGEERFRWVLDGIPSRGALMRVADAGRLDVPAYAIVQKLDLDEQRVPRQPFALADLLPPPGEARALTLDAGPQWAGLTREFAALAGIALEQTQRSSFSLADVLHTVLGRGLVLLGDLREPPRVEYAVQDVASRSSTADGSRIPVRLFRLKNGNAADRRQYAAIQGLFRRLTGRTFDIAFASMSPEQGEESAATLQISAVVDHHGHDLAVDFAGAGMWEALLLSATLPESAGLVAVLDEPARNLHPTLQRRLLTEMRRAPGQFILTTHSPYLVSMSEHRDLIGIVRFETAHGVTRQRRLASGGEPGSARLRKALGESADARALLFARGVVLVEGGTELGALPEWFGKSVTAERFGAPDALNVVIFSVDGDRSFGTFIAFLHAFGVPWAIVCDGSVYRFGTGKRQIFEQVLGAGIDDSDLRKAVDQAAAGDPAGFGELRDLGENSGIFTLAESWDAPAEGFEAYLATAAPGQLADAAKMVGNSKPRQGRHVASATECPDTIEVLYGKILCRLGVT